MPVIEFRCMPACLNCETAGICSADLAPGQVAERVAEKWYPNRELDVLLKCGCYVGWPLCILLGSHGQQAWCETHNVFSHITKKQITTAQKMMAELRRTGQLELDF